MSVTTPPSESIPSLLVKAERRAQAGDLAGARTIYLSLIDQPAYTGTCLYRLGLIAGVTGDHARAAQLIRQALRLKPDQWDAYPALCAALDRSGQAGASNAALIELGCGLSTAGQQERAATVFRQVITRDPLSYPGWFNLGHCLVRLKKAAEATPFLATAVRLCARVDPGVANLIAEIDRRIADPLFQPPQTLPAGLPSGPIDKTENALTSLGTALSAAHFVDEAILCHRQALAINPGYALAHWNLALGLLDRDQWREGWLEYEWRWHWPECPEPARHLPVPIWHGEPLAGRQILVWTEQGHGDAIQFVPLVPRLQALGAEVWLETTRPLRRLFAHSFPGVTLLDRPDRPDRLSAPAPPDYVIPLMSLPERLGLAVEALPLAECYLRPPAEDVARWAGLLRYSGRPRVGLIWAGYTNVMPWPVAQTLLREEGIAWHTLQLGPEQAHLAAAPLPGVRDLSPQLRDFADTAAVLGHLDLLITIDTATAHLAGALARPVWVMLDHLPNWRWAGDGAASPWYPSMRLFRHGRSESWQPVVARVAQALREWRQHAAADAAAPP